MLANTMGVMTRFRVTETLIFAGDRSPITLDPETVKRPASWQAGSSIRYRAEWQNDPAAAYSWSWFDHHPDLVAIRYAVERL
jgi:hypothetical protein